MCPLSNLWAFFFDTPPKRLVPLTTHSSAEPEYTRPCIPCGGEDTLTRTARVLFRSERLRLGVTFSLLSSADELLFMFSFMNAYLRRFFFALTVLYNLLSSVSNTVPSLIMSDCRTTFRLPHRLVFSASRSYIRPSSNWCCSTGIAASVVRILPSTNTKKSVLSIPFFQL